MDPQRLSRRVSTRASLACSTVRHVLTANPSIQSSSSRPTAPIAMSPEALDPINRSNLRSSTRPSSPLMTLEPPCPSNPSLSSPALPPTQVQSCGDGQFSDADSDDDIIQPREKKRLKLDCAPSTQRNGTQPPPPATRLAACPKLHATHHRPGVDCANGSAIKQVVFSGTIRKSVAEKNVSHAPKTTVITNSRSGKTTATPSVTPNQTLSLKCDSSSQLPMATRRLAMLVGIPESSQAIIQSTLSLPSSRTPGRTSHPQSNVIDTYSTSTSKHTEATTSLPNSHRQASSNYGKTIVDSCASSTNIDSCINPILSASNDCSSPARCSPLVMEKRGTCKTLKEPTGNSSAPRYGKTSNSYEDFTMPAPGTFSIRAPSSSQILRSFSSATDLELPEASSHDLNRIEQCEEASAPDVLNKAPSTCRTPSHDDATTIITAMTPGSTVADVTEGRKRKARSCKPKSASQSGRNESGESGIELVKPPPTINGKVSHARKVPPGYVKRTPNSFLMFRSHVIANKLLPPGVENDNRQISRVVSGLWAGLSEHDLRTWQEASRELRAAVRAQNPGLKHAPNQKRREVIRRRRNGQLPGETPEQRVEREKATAAALAKVIIEGRGEQLDKEKLIELANISMQPPASNTSINARETSRPEFRAPSYHLNNSTLIRGITPRSECAESTLTNSPVADHRRSLSCVPETHPDILRCQQTPLTPKTTASGPSTIQSSHESQDSNEQSPRHQPVAPVNQVRKNQPSSDVKHKSESNLLDSISPEIISQQPLKSPTCPHPKKLSLHPSPSESSSNIFLALGVTDGTTQPFPNTFSNEMLRSLGLTASDLGLNLGPSEVNSTVDTSTMNDATSFNQSFSTQSNRSEQNPRVWNHETRFRNLENFRATTPTTSTITTTTTTTAASYPFRDLGINESMSSQDTSSIIINDEDSCTSTTLVDQLSQLDASNPLELSSLINECYTEPLNCEGLNFDSLYLNCTPSSLSNLDFEDSHHHTHPFSSNLFDAHLNNPIEQSNSNLTNSLWDCKDS